MSFKQYDSGVSLLKYLITDDGTAISLSGATGVLLLKMPDKTVKTLTADVVAPASAGGITFITTSTTLDQIGHYQGQYVVTFSPTKIIKSDRFHFDVEAGIA